MGYALVTILAVFLIACVVAAATRGSSVGPAPGDGVFGFANRIDLGESLQQASEWASPQFATVLLFGSLGMAWWQVETWSPDESETVSTDASTHLMRASLLIRCDQVISVLCVIGAVFFVIGGVLLSADSSVTISSIGLGLGSVVLGCVGWVASRRLSATCRMSLGVPDTL